MKRTALYGIHQKLGGRLIEFGGWEMPVQYSGIVDEHLTVRSAAGLFDISHMGEVLVRGAGAQAFLNQTLCNDVRKLVPGLGQYTLMCNERGGVIDDLYVYRLAEQEYLLIINASRIDDDVRWLEDRHARFENTAEVTVNNVSDATAAVAVQGPRVTDFIDSCFPGGSQAGTSVGRITELKKNQIGQFKFDGLVIWTGRTGYTGEDGFEIVAPNEAIEGIWGRLIASGQPHGLKPAGLGARDTLRTEVCYPLYGHELDEFTTPMEAGLGFFVALDKGEFVGRPALAEQKLHGTAKRLVAFKMTEKSAPPRPHYPLWSTGVEGREIGEVTSGTQSPSLGIGIGLGYVPADLAKPPVPLQVEIRGKLCSATTVTKPIYRKVG